MELFTHFTYLAKKFSDCMDLLLIFEENKSHYVYIKDFNRLIFNKKRTKKCIFVGVVCNILVVKMFGQNIKKTVW